MDMVVLIFLHFRNKELHVVLVLPINFDAHDLDGNSMNSGVLIEDNLVKF